MGGTFMTNGCRAQLWQSELLFLGDMLEKSWSSGEYPFRSSHDQGFAPFELLTPERAEPLPSFKEPSSLLAFTVVYMNIQITKQIGGGAQWVELSTEGMGEPTYGLSLSSCLVKGGSKN